MQTVDDKPIACTLGRNALAPRLAEIRAFKDANLLSNEMTDRVLRLRYRPKAARNRHDGGAMAVRTVSPGASPATAGRILRLPSRRSMWLTCRGSTETKP